MTKDEYISLRIAELTARKRYAENLVMNREMAHETKMCELQIEMLIELQDGLKPINETIEQAALRLSDQSEGQDNDG